jgi:hypothetical protein
MKLLILLVGALCVLSINSNAQSVYAGKYWVVCSWGTGYLAGLGSTGPATATRNGKVVITQYFGDDSSASIGATINKKGLFKLNSPNVGSSKIYTAGKKRFASCVVGVAGSGNSSGGIATFSNVYLP